MKLIVGLGNPGLEYENTRHNVGFMAINKYLNNVSFKTKFDGEYYIDNEKNAIFLKPMKYMNLSGEVVKKFVDYYKITVDDILIMYDDMAFELGTIKIKPDGSCGGHNGIKNIIDLLDNNKIKRVRIGIGRNSYNMKDYVLGRFSKKELLILDDVMQKVVNIIDDYLKLDFDKLMNKYN